MSGTIWQDPFGHQDWSERKIVKRADKAERKQTLKDVARTHPGSIVREVKYSAGKNRSVHGHTDANMRKVEEMEAGEARVKRVGGSVSRLLAQARNAKGWSQKDLAQRVNVKPQIIAQYERGRAVPNTALIQQMERALGCRVRPGGGSGAGAPKQKRGPRR